MGSCEVECGVGWLMWAVCMCLRWCVQSSVGMRVCCVDICWECCVLWRITLDGLCL